MGDADHLADEFKTDDAFMQNVITTQLIAWQRYLMPGGEPPDKMEMETLRGLACNIIGLLTYRLHGQHPYYDHPDAIKTLVGRKLWHKRWMSA